MSRRHDVGTERWWAEYEDVDGNVSRVEFAWHQVGRGIYAVVPQSVEFDLFVPLSVQDELTDLLRNIRVTAVSQRDE